MHHTSIVLKKYIPVGVLKYLCLFICLALTAYRIPPGNVMPGNKSNYDKPDGVLASGPVSYWGPLRLQLLSAASLVANDPIRFSVQCSKQSIRVDETIELTITAELLNISPNLLFFQPGSNAYTLKMLLPPGFEQTGGDFADYTTGELSYPAHPLMTYHIRGHFRSVTPNTGFRLLRGQGQASDQSLFVEKAVVTLQTGSTEKAVSQLRKTAAESANPTHITLYVVTENSATGAAREAAASYLGFLDYAACDAVRGWIVNTNDMHQSQEVDIYINGIKVATVLADLDRQDVANALGVNGFNEYGFKWVIPEYYKYKAPLTLSVRPADTSTDLSRSPYQTSPCYSTGISLQPPRTSPTVTVIVPPTSTTSLASFRRGVVIGNSFTSHPVAMNLGWFLNNGMAASNLANDYVHKIETALKGVNPAFEMLALGSGSNLETFYNSVDVQSIANNINNIRFDIGQRYGTEKIDLLIISISENVDNGAFNETKFRSMLDQLMAGLADKLTTGATVLFRNGLWLDHEQADVVLKSYAQEKGYKFADMADLKETRVNGVLTWPYYANTFNNAGVRRHPNDAGHAAIANRFLNQLKSSSTPLPPPTNNPFAWQVPATQSAWDGVNSNAIGYQRIVAGNYLTQENNQLRIELREGFGGSMQIYDKVTNQNLINFFDQGRESGLSSYSYPLSFSNYAAGPDQQAWWDIGYNPVPPGNHGGTPSPILFRGKIDGWLYTKAQSISWPHIVRTTLPMTYEQWVKIDGNKVHVKVRLVHSRLDKTQYESRSQEWPFMMINGAKVTRFYNGDQPFSFQQTTGTNGIERVENGKSILHQGTPFYVTEPWMGVDIAPNRMIGLIAPTMYKSNYNVAEPDRGDNVEGGNTITYICGQPGDHLDSDKATYFEYTYVVGTETEVRQMAYSIPRTAKPDFSFTRANGRAGWVWFDGAQDQKEPFSSDNWKLTFTGKTENGVTSANNTKLISPAGSWQAAQIPVMYVRMKTNTSRRQMALSWARNQQAPDGAHDPKYPNQNQIRYPRGPVNNVAQRQVFNVNGNNQWNTYAIPVGNNVTWSGTIQQLELKHDGDDRVPINETFEISYIGATNPGN